MGQFHQPVLLQAVCDALCIRPGGRFIDATLGGGGHTRQIISLGGEVLGLDQDPEALSACPDSDHLIKVRGNFSHLAQIAADRGWAGIQGVLFDLGVSSHQINSVQRGFSFQTDGPLDMRMDPGLAVTAADLVNGLSAKQLSGMFRTFGEEKTAAGIAKKIVSRRPFLTTGALAKILPDPSVRRRVFQALRIAVNDELNSLSAALPQALSLLSSGGRIVVISFHSLEDRVVKNLFSQWEKSGLGRMAETKPLVPNLAEISRNSRAKSSKLRTFIKL